MRAPRSVLSATGDTACTRPRPGRPRPAGHTSRARPRTGARCREPTAQDSSKPQPVWPSSAPPFRPITDKMSTESAETETFETLELRAQPDTGEQDPRPRWRPLTRRRTASGPAEADWSRCPAARTSKSESNERKVSKEAARFEKGDDEILNSLWSKGETTRQTGMQVPWVKVRTRAAVWGRAPTPRRTHSTERSPGQSRLAEWLQRQAKPMAAEDRK